MYGCAYSLAPETTKGIDTSPFNVRTNRSTPCAAGCWGPKFTVRFCTFFSTIVANSANKSIHLQSFFPTIWKTESCHPNKKSAYFVWLWLGCHKDTCSKLQNDVTNIKLLTLTLPGPSAGMSGSLDSYCSLKPLCSGMGEVVPARTSPTLLPPSPRTVPSLSCFKVLQCINCRD